MTTERNYVNNVNDSPQPLLRGVAFGRGGKRASSACKASQVVIQRKPCKERIRIGTWNVRSMRRPGKLANVVREMRKARLDILGLAEVRWKEGGDFTSEGVRVIYTEDNKGQSGVAILLEDRVAKCVTEIERCGDSSAISENTGTPSRHSNHTGNIYANIKTYEEEEVYMDLRIGLHGNSPRMKCVEINF